MNGSRGGTVKEAMQRYLEIVPHDATVAAAAEQMSGRGIGCVLVESDDAKRGPIGVVTEADLVQKVLAMGLNPAITRVTRVMNSPPLTISAECSMLNASHAMDINQVRHLCVVEGGEIVGLISVRDLVRWFVNAESGPVCELDKVYRPLGVLMASAVATIGCEESVLVAAHQMRERRIGSLFTVEAGELVGIVTERDLVRKVLVTSQDASKVLVSAVMGSPLQHIDVNRTIRDASQLMAELAVRHLAVSEKGKLVGVLSIRDLVKMVSVWDRPQFLGYE